MSSTAKALIITWMVVGFLVVGTVGFYLGRATSPNNQSSLNQQGKGGNQPTGSSQPKSSGVPQPQGNSQQQQKPSGY